MPPQNVEDINNGYTLIKNRFEELEEEYRKGFKSYVKAIKEIVSYIRNSEDHLRVINIITSLPIYSGLYDLDMRVYDNFNRFKRTGLEEVYRSIIKNSNKEINQKTAQDLRNILSYFVYKDKNKILPREEVITLKMTNPFTYKLTIATIIAIYSMELPLTDVRIIVNEKYKERINKKFLKNYNPEEKTYIVDITFEELREAVKDERLKI